MLYDAGSNTFFLAQVLLLPFRIEKWMPTLLFPLSSGVTGLVEKKGRKQIDVVGNTVKGGNKSASSLHIFAAVSPFPYKP